jgi:hypothetical protein
MPSLRELQQRFAAAVLAPAGADPGFAIAGRASAAERVGIYRNAIAANYRNALRTSYPVVARLVGGPFFDAAVDAFARVHPSTCGDLNVCGDAFGDFLAGYPHAAGLPYLGDVARLEWAVDEAQRAADAVADPGAVLAALAAVPAEQRTAIRLRLDPSCRFVASAFPILHIWQANQPGHGDENVDLAEGGERLCVRRGDDGVTLVRIDAGDYAFLAALAADATLGAAVDAAVRADAAFDLRAALRANIAAGVIAEVAARRIRTRRPS